MNKKKEVKNMKDEEKLLNAIHENHKRVYERTIKNQVKESKKKNRKEKLISIILVLIFITLMILNWKITDKAVIECVRDGNTENYCISKLG